MPPSVYLLVGSNPGLSDSVCVSFSDRSEASSFDLLLRFLHLPFSLSQPELLLFLALHLSLCQSYIAPSRAGVRTNCARSPAQSGRNPSFPHRHGRCRRKENGHADRRGDDERSRCEIRHLFPPGFIRPSPASFSVSSLSLSLFLSLCVAPAAVLLRVRSRVYVRAARGVTYPLENHTAPATVGISPCHWSQTTLGNPMESANTTPTSGPWKRIRETPGKSRSIARSLSRSLVPDPRRQDSTPDTHLHATPSPRIRSHIRMLETRRLVAITAGVAIGRQPVRPFPPFAKNRVNIYLDKSFSREKSCGSGIRRNGQRACEDAFLFSLTSNFTYLYRSFFSWHIA